MRAASILALAMLACGEPFTAATQAALTSEGGGQPEAEAGQPEAEAGQPEAAPLDAGIAEGSDGPDDASIADAPECGVCTVGVAINNLVSGGFTGLVEGDKWTADCQADRCALVCQSGACTDTFGNMKCGTTDCP
jgi:hypothetical protein